MSSWPGPSLEDYVRDAYFFQSEEEYTAKVRELEPAREFIEDRVLADFDHDHQSWRDYRNSCADLIAEIIARKAKTGIYTAWGCRGRASLLIEGKGPPTAAQWRVEADGGPPELVWRIEAESWEDACRQYHELQGWESYVPMAEG